VHFEYEPKVTCQGKALNQFWDKQRNCDFSSSSAAQKCSLSRLLFANLNLCTFDSHQAANFVDTNALQCILIDLCKSRSHEALTTTVKILFLFVGYIYLARRTRALHYQFCQLQNCPLVIIYWQMAGSHFWIVQFVLSNFLSCLTHSIFKMRWRKT